METTDNDATETRLDHDAARRQGPGVRHRVPARLGGRPVPQPARARRERPGRPRGGAPPRLCRPHPRAPPRQDLSSPPTAASTACGSPPFPRASSTNCPRRMWRSPRRRPSYGGYGGSRFDRMAPFGSTYNTPGWQRAQERTRQGGGRRNGQAAVTAAEFGRRRALRRTAAASASATPALQRLGPQGAAADRGRTRRQVHRRELRLRARASASSTSSSATARSPASTATS